MDAVVCRGFGESSVERVEEPTPDGDEVVIEVSRVQLSVTECQLYQGKKLAAYETVRERMASGDGRVFGHEFCGRVVKAGDEVGSLSVGDRVYAPAKISCGACPYCEAGYEQLCGEKETIGMARPGALAEYVALPAAPLWTLPDEVSDTAGAAMQPLASALVCVEDADVGTGDVVAVVGCGVMGYQSGQLALDRGAGQVIAIDVDAEKLAYAEERGMETVDASETDAVAAVNALTGGVGADVVFEAVGGEQSDATSGSEPLAQAFAMVRPGGTVGQVGQIVGELTLDPRVVRKKSVTWVNPRYGAWPLGPNAHTGALAPQLVADGRVSIEEYTTHEFEGLERFEDAVDVTTNKPAHGALGPAQLVL